MFILFISKSLPNYQLELPFLYNVSIFQYNVYHIYFLPLIIACATVKLTQNSLKL